MTSDLRPFRSSRYTVDRAKRHLQDLNAHILTFFDGNPYTRVVETDTNRAEDIHKIKLAKPMPAALPGIAFDVLNNLRSALDQAGFAVAVAAGKSGKKAKFPFGDTLIDVKRRASGNSKDIPQKIFWLMESLQPYKGGNDVLWALNKATNANKHEFIAPVAIAIGNSVLGKAQFPFFNRFCWPPMWDRSKNEMELARVPNGTTFEINFEIQTFVAFGKIQGIDGQPVLGVLDAMLNVVESSLVAIEAESRRLGIFT